MLKRFVASWTLTWISVFDAAVIFRSAWRGLMVAALLVGPSCPVLAACSCRYEISYPAATLQPRVPGTLGIGEAFSIYATKHTQVTNACAATFVADPVSALEYLDSPSSTRADFAAPMSPGRFTIRAIGAGGECKGKVIGFWHLQVIEPTHFSHAKPVLTEPYIDLQLGPPDNRFGGRWSFTTTLHPATVNFDHLRLRELVYPISFYWPNGRRNDQPSETIEFNTRVNRATDAVGMREPNPMRLVHDLSQPFFFDLVLDNQYQAANGTWKTFEAGEVHRHIVSSEGGFHVQILHNRGATVQSEAVGPWQ
jgi:hypothetical protein